MAQLHSDQLNDIDALIRQENDAEKRNVLLILQSLTIGLIHVVDTMDTIETRTTAKDVVYVRKMEEYDTTLAKGKTIWKVLTVLYMVAQGAIVGVAGYSYQTISEIRDMSYSNKIKLEAMQQEILFNREQSAHRYQNLIEKVENVKEQKTDSNK